MRSLRVALLTVVILVLTTAPSYAWSFTEFVDKFYDHANNLANLMGKTHGAIDASNYALYEIGSLPANVQGMMNLGKQALSAFGKGTVELVTGKPVSQSLPQDAVSQTFLKHGVTNSDQIFGALGILNGNGDLGPQYTAIAKEMGIDITTPEGKARFAEVMVAAGRNFDAAPGPTKTYRFDGSGLGAQNPGENDRWSQFENGGIIGKRLNGRFNFIGGTNRVFVGSEVAVEAYFGAPEDNLQAVDAPAGMAFAGGGPGYAMFRGTFSEPGQYSLSFHAQDISGQAYTIVSSVPLYVASLDSARTSDKGGKTPQASNQKAGTPVMVETTDSAAIDAAMGRVAQKRASLEDLDLLAAAGMLRPDQEAYRQKLHKEQGTSAALPSEASSPVAVPSAVTGAAVSDGPALFKDSNGVYHWASPAEGAAKGWKRADESGSGSGAASQPSPSKSILPAPSTTKTPIPKPQTIEDVFPELKALHNERNLWVNKADRAMAEVNKLTEQQKSLKNKLNNPNVSRTEKLKVQDDLRKVESDLKKKTAEYKPLRQKAIEMDRKWKARQVELAASGKMGAEAKKAVEQANRSGLAIDFNQVKALADRAAQMMGVVNGKLQ